MNQLRRVSLRHRVSRAVRRWLRKHHWRSEQRKLEKLREFGRGRRAFLVGNGPSLARMDLSRLREEFVCVTNMGLRAIGNILPHADMHVVMDSNRYRRFADEIERLTSVHGVRFRFLNLRMRRRWRRKGKGSRPFFCTVNPDKFELGKPAPDLTEGVVTGNVLLSAAVLLDHMGFAEIYVIGCDLDYDSSGQYFYRMESLDVVHEEDADVRARRATMVLTNDQFAALRAEIERKGKRILNAGLGGRLESLPRVDFESLFTAPAIPSAV